MLSTIIIVLWLIGLVILFYGVFGEPSNYNQFVSYDRPTIRQQWFRLRASGALMIAIGMLLIVIDKGIG